MVMSSTEWQEASSLVDLQTLEAFEEASPTVFKTQSPQSILILLMVGEGVERIL